MLTKKTAPSNMGTSIYNKTTYYSMFGIPFDIDYIGLG